MYGSRSYGPDALPEIHLTSSSRTHRWKLKALISITHWSFFLHPLPDSWGKGAASFILALWLVFLFFIHCQTLEARALLTLHWLSDPLVFLFFIHYQTLEARAMLTLHWLSDSLVFLFIHYQTLEARALLTLHWLSDPLVFLFIHYQTLEARALLTLNGSLMPVLHKY